MGDIKLAGMLDAAFVRSPVAHGRIISIDVPEQFHGAVFTAKDLTGLKTIRANSGLKGFKSSEQPALASNKVRLVGELLSVCVGGSRALAEDVVDEVFANIEELAEEKKSLEKRKISKKSGNESSESESEDENGSSEIKINALNQNNKIKSISQNQEKLYDNLNMYGAFSDLG